MVVCFLIAEILGHFLLFIWLRILAVPLFLMARNPGGSVIWNTLICRSLIEFVFL